MRKLKKKSPQKMAKMLNFAHVGVLRTVTNKRGCDGKRALRGRRTSRPREKYTAAVAAGRRADARVGSYG